jgi:phenylalanyl-tRNA synthetase beta chain
MPVIQLSLQHLEHYCQNKASAKTILDTLPYLGLDIEDQAGDLVNVEYSPNRPDFSSEVGIARSLAGILGIATGVPKYEFPRSNYSVQIKGKEILSVRPFIEAIYAEISVTDELIKQMIAMQEDVHNGIGRKRSKVAIGIHNAGVITNSLKYFGTIDDSFSFVPLGTMRKQSIKEILHGTDQGKEYGKLLSSVSPLLVDSKDKVLSMPPVINGELTRLKPGVSKLFIDLTGTDERVVDVSTAIIASMLSDTGAKVYSVKIDRADGSSTWTPDMHPSKMRFDLELTNKNLGFDFDLEQARVALEKSRLGLDDAGHSLIPRFRSDIIHPIDLSEEVALGYGIAHFTPQEVASSLSGSLSRRLRSIDSVIELFIGMGFTEIWNFSLTSKDVVAHYRDSEILKVEDSKSESFQFLRVDLITSLLRVLGASTHLEYPQRIFEEAPIFRRESTSTTEVLEQDHIAAALADSEANYTKIRSHLDAFLKLVMGPSNFHLETESDAAGIYAEGRTAGVFIREKSKDTRLGTVGEISPSTLERFGLAVPVAAFELNLEPILKD